LEEKTKIIKKPTNNILKNSTVSIGFIGSGDYASSVLIPAFTKKKVRLKSIVSNKGVTGLSVGRKFGFENTTTDPQSLLDDNEIDTIVVATRHDSHSQLVIDCLNSNKNIFVEKPLCINLEELSLIESALEKNNSNLLMVGFNRRFSPHIKKIKNLLDKNKTIKKSFIYTVNAGHIPNEHWIHDPEKGGGRIVGEVCHFIDLLRFLSSSQIIDWKCTKMDTLNNDTLTITLYFKNGSIGSIHYFANGNKSFPKERLEVFCNGQILQLDNFRKLKSYGWSKFNKYNLFTQNKGQENCVSSFINSINQGGAPPIAIDELLEVTKVSIEIDNYINVSK